MTLFLIHLSLVHSSQLLMKYRVDIIPLLQGWYMCFELIICSRLVGSLVVFALPVAIKGIEQRLCRQQKVHD